MVIGRDFSGGSSIFEFRVSAPLPLAGASVIAGFEDAGAVALDGVADVFELDETSVAALLLV
jgi:hypothetical protein